MTTGTSTARSMHPITNDRIRVRRTHRSVFTVRELLQDLTQNHSLPATTDTVDSTGSSHESLPAMSLPQNLDLGTIPPGYKMLLGAVYSLAHAMQDRNPYMTGHSRRVGMFSRSIAEAMDLSSEWVEQISFAGELHDIGEIRIPRALLLKEATLTEDEYEEVMQHTIIGEEIVSSIPLKDPTLRHVARWHHERCDGRGGPDGLSGDKIPLAARIVAVADAFDAMTSERPYRPAMCVDLARYEIRKQAGKQFDPGCIQAFDRVLDQMVPPTDDDDNTYQKHRRLRCAA